MKFRLEKFEAKDWRTSYNAVILLEHALTHGPKSFAEEFEDHKDVLREMDGFHFVDEKGLVKYLDSISYTSFLFLLFIFKL